MSFSAGVPENLSKKRQRRECLQAAANGEPRGGVLVPDQLRAGHGVPGHSVCLLPCRFTNRDTDFNRGDVPRMERRNLGHRGHGESAGTYTYVVSQLLAISL